MRKVPDLDKASCHVRVPWPLSTSDDHSAHALDATAQAGVYPCAGNLARVKHQPHKAIGVDMKCPHDEQSCVPGIVLDSKSGKNVRKTDSMADDVSVICCNCRKYAVSDVDMWPPLLDCCLEVYKFHKPLFAAVVHG